MHAVYADHKQTIWEYKFVHLFIYLFIYLHGALNDSYSL